MTLLDPELDEEEVKSRFEKKSSIRKEGRKKRKSTFDDRRLILVQSSLVE